MYLKTPKELTLLLLAGTCVAAGCQRVESSPSGTTSGTTSGKAQTGITAPAKAGPRVAVNMPKKKPGNGPKIACDKSVHNFGKVIQGKSVEHTFVVVNRGKEQLHIERARGG
jgi:hypothetical protein